MDDTAPCPGRHTTPVPGMPVWCRPCQTTIQARLFDLPGQYVRLVANGAAETTGGELVSGSRAPREVSKGVAHADEILRTVCGWEDALAGHLHHGPAVYPCSHSNHGAALWAAVAYLGRFHTAAMAAPFAVDYGQEIPRFARQAEALLRASTAPTSLSAPCPDCDLLTLRRKPGSDTVSCAYCGWHRTWDQYQKYVASLTGEADVA